jgi:hypothetical protein
VVIFVAGVYELTFANGYELKGAAGFDGGSSRLRALQSQHPTNSDLVPEQ